LEVIGFDGCLCRFFHTVPVSPTSQPTWPGPGTFVFPPHSRHHRNKMVTWGEKIPITGHNRGSSSSAVLSTLRAAQATLLHSLPPVFPVSHLSPHRWVRENRKFIRLFPRRGHGPPLPIPLSLTMKGLDFDLQIEMEATFSISATTGGEKLLNLIDRAATTYGWGRRDGGIGCRLSTINTPHHHRTLGRFSVAGVFVSPFHTHFPQRELLMGREKGGEGGGGG